ncbi:zinc-binding oxidoreductase [Polyplosphaeria fusca]|uniref:Zinc-binding oxidoreductase n=1 Tax=Polyplosphaeria fusca TaxID=682080 RepID=A0A9P4QZP3_9PLEO|nr:zinc-binding oxidoreductase [Polyplosphaeria fusca]
MSTRRAVINKTGGGAEIKADVPLPKLRDDYIIVKTKAVALNPTDWKGAYGARNSPGAIVGCDYAGIVDEVGKAVTTPFKKGDRVAGFIRGNDGSNHDNGAFAQVATAKGDLQIRIADSVSFEDAATLGVGITTVGQGLFQALELPLPPNKVSKPTPILIYGASTATGTLAVQYAKLVGATVYATASPHNFDLLKSLGADHVYNYRDAGVAAKIREDSDDSIRLVFDCIAELGSPDFCGDAMSSKGGQYSALLSAKVARDDVKSGFTLAYTAIGEDYSPNFPANKDDFDFGVKFWRLSEDLINSGKIKTHPADVRGGLDDIIQGLEDLKAGKVSGAKLVYTID